MRRVKAVEMEMRPWNQSLGMVRLDINDHNLPFVDRKYSAAIAARSELHHEKAYLALDQQHLFARCRGPETTGHPAQRPVHELYHARLQDLPTTALRHKTHGLWLTDLACIQLT